jgi:uncharacterized protein
VRAARFLIPVALAAMLAFAALPYWISAFIFRPAPLERTDPRLWGLEGSSFVEFRAADGSRLTGWWTPPPEARGTVVLLVHGRSANMATRAGIARRLGDDGFGVMMFDYRGFGASSGEPGEQGLTEDTVAAYDWLRARGVRSRQLIVLGQSLGNAPAARLAAERPVAALALVSPFTSLPDALADRLPWLPFRSLAWTRGRYEVAASLSALRVPLLLIASRADGLVPLANARKGRPGGAPSRALAGGRQPPP